MSTCSGPPAGICAGATAVAAPADVVAWGTGEATSVSRISAPSPLPNAFLAIRDDLLCKVDIGFRASTMNVVEVDGLAMAWSFGQADVSGYDGFKDLSAEEAAKVRSHLFR